MASLLERLKERKMVQWALAYLAGAWGTLEVLDVLADPLGVTDAFKLSVVVLLVFGLAAALVVAWFHAEKGRQRVSTVEVAVLAALLVGGISASVVSYRLGGPGAAPGTDARIASVLSGPVVAVLPFDNNSAGEEGAKFIVDGIQGEILSNLSRMTGLNAISRTSVLGYDRASRTVRQIAEDLGASAILEGQIQKVGNALRINVTLIDGLTDRPIWSEIYDRVMDPASVFAVQGEIASAIAEALAVTLAPAEQSRLSRVATRDQEALELFMLGQEAEDRGNRGERPFYRQAAAYYEQALERDPEYAEAQAAHGRMIWRVYWYVPGAPRTPVIVDSVRTAAERAIELDPEFAAGHVLLGTYYAWHTTDNAAATESYLQARRLDPDNVAALTGLASMNMEAGDFQTARANLLRAAQLDPRDRDSQRLAFMVAVYMRRWDDAARHFEKAVRRFTPNWDIARDLSDDPVGATVAYTHLISLHLAADGNTGRAYEALMEWADRVGATSEQMSVFMLHDRGTSPVNIGPTLLSMPEVREYLRADPDFPRPYEVQTRAWLERMAGDDPQEEQRLWAIAGSRITDDQYGGGQTEVRVTFRNPGEELELRPQAALMFARGGRHESALLEMNRSKEVSDAYPLAELTLAAEVRWAMTYVELGEHDVALDMLEDMMSRPSALSVGLLKVQPEWDPIREEPRFQALLAGG